MTDRETVRSAYEAFTPERSRNEGQGQVDVLYEVVSQGPIGVVNLAKATGLAHHQIRKELRSLEELNVIEPASTGAQITDSFSETLAEHRTADDPDGEFGTGSTAEHSQRERLSDQLEEIQNEVTSGREESLRRSYDVTVDELVELGEIAVTQTEDAGGPEQEAHELLHRVAEVVSSDQAEELTVRAANEFTPAVLYSAGSVIYRNNHPPGQLVTVVSDLVGVLENERTDRRVLQAISGILATIAYHDAEALETHIGELITIFHREINQSSIVSFDEELLMMSESLAFNTPDAFESSIVETLVTVADSIRSDNRYRVIRVLRHIAEADPQSVRTRVDKLSYIADVAIEDGDEQSLAELCRLMLVIGGDTAEELLSRIASASESPDIVAEVTESWTPPEGSMAHGKSSTADQLESGNNSSPRTEPASNTAEATKQSAEQSTPVSLDADSPKHPTNRIPIPDPSQVASPPRQDLAVEDLTVGEAIDTGGQAVVRRAELPGENGTTIAVREPNNDGSLPRAAIETFHERVDVWSTIDARERELPRWEESEHVVGIVDSGDHAPWVATEYMDGGTLSGLIADNPDGLPIEQALWIGECICKGIYVAHETGVAHLDITPENVLLKETNNWPWPKIADWGLARRLASETGTRNGFSVEYAAPEQIDSDRFGEPDTLTDVYGVGATVYELLTGTPPNDGSSIKATQSFMDSDTPVPPSYYREELSERVDAVVERALKREKTERYDGVAAFGRALKGVRNERHSSTSETRSTSSQANTSTSAAHHHSSQTISHSQNRSSPTASTAVDCPTFQQNTARTGVLSTGSHVTDDCGATEGLEVCWSAELEGEELGNPLVTEDAMYVVARDDYGGTLYALDPNSGDEQWTLSIKADRTTGMTPVLYDDTLIVPGRKLYSIDTSTRDINWSHAVYPITSHPTVADRMVYIGGRDGLHAFDLHSGNKDWTLETEHEVGTCPTYYDGTVVVGSQYGPLHAVSPSGERKWTVDFPSGRQHHVTAAAKDGILYTGVRRSYEDDLYAFDIESGERLWACETPAFSGQVHTVPVVAEEQIFVTTNYGGTGELHALDLNTRESAWKLETDEKLRSPPAVTTDSVYVCCPDGTLYVCDRHQGKIRDEIDLSTADPSGMAPSMGPPIVVGNRVYLTGIENTLFALSRPE